MLIKAPAKINLFLEVGRKKGNLHEIFSLVDVVSLYDLIYLKPSKKTKIEFISEWEIPKENTVYKLISILKKKFDFDVEIKIEKNIPPGTGLGGGSSDAGTILIYLNKFFNFGLKIEEMVEIAKNVGSDVPLFIYQKRCIIKNFGEVVIPVSDFKLYYLILIPEISIKTKDVYDKLDEIGEYGDLTDLEDRVNILIEEIKKGNILEVENNMFNRLERVCFEINSYIKEVKYEVEKLINRRFFLTGSGCALFSIFKEKEEVEKIEEKIFIDNCKKFKVESINFGM
jgi:4-diphosphocytidyl-2-C-methyl-D-erythritol kinase